MQEGIKVASHISDKGIVSRVYKRLLQLNNKKTNDLILKREKKYFNIDKPMRQKNTHEEAQHHHSFIGCTC